ncbi:MAG TPA: RNA 2',3'-cyclic phosphodiesterase, partial [Micromonosporaceae bacterium]|nr:RNA 2',3'-cyclic phosphodiesterase [Micromonosporaceae bacterium]
MRLFVAVYPPAEVLDDLESTVRGLGVAKATADGTNTRLISRALWHLTVAFIGEVPDSRVLDATRALDRAADHLSGVQPRLSFSGGGRFGRGRFTVLWAGLTGDTTGLSTVARTVHAELRHGRLP